MPIKCPWPGCQGNLTLYYEGIKSVEFYLEEIDEDGSLYAGDILEFDFGDAEPDVYCDAGQHKGQPFDLEDIIDLERVES